MAEFAGGRLFLLGSSLLAIGTAGFYYLPGTIEADAGGSRLVNSIYCSTMTLTTVGFGDISPGADMDIIGRAFIVVLSFCGLGMFCGPVMDFASSWTQDIPGGAIGAALTTLALGIGLFTVLEDFSETEAAYFTFIVGSTIGYGDKSPSSDAGKIAAAIFAILVINVTGGLLEPAASFLSLYCTKRDAPAIEGNGTGKKVL